MNSQFRLDLLDEDHRPKPALRPASYDARHRLPEPQRPPLPSWAQPPASAEVDLGLIGEGPTQVLYPSKPSPALPMPVQPRPEAVTHRSKPSRFAALLARVQPWGRR